MAVPFSRPAYPRARRPRDQPQQPQAHPITRFLEGRGGIRLDQLSFTSRVAFYALYEAYRLLMDLTNGQNLEHEPSTNDQRPEQQSQQHTVHHQAPVSENPSENITLPDILESTQSRQHEPCGLHGQRQSSDKCSDKVRPDLIEHVHHHHNDSVLDFYPD